MKKKIRIATRNSLLALQQTKEVQKKLLNAYPELFFEIIPIKTKGDIILDNILVNLGGKGLFIKELEIAILENRADIAIHSIKDLPIKLTSKLIITAICQREDPRDAFISNLYKSIDDLPLNSKIGTSSIRRKCQLNYHRPDLKICNLRGNLDTRLKKLDNGYYDAIILAVSGLNRLKLNYRIKQILPTEFMLPAIGQGAIGVQCRFDDTNIINLLTVINHYDTAICIEAERSMNFYLNGSCQMPIAGLANIKNNRLCLRGLVGTPNGDKIIKSEFTLLKTQYKKIGVILANNLIKIGAKNIISKI